MADYRDFGGEGHYVSCIGPWDEIDGDGTEASIIADHIRDLGR